jgi:hypothetical protein
MTVGWDPVSRSGERQVVDRSPDCWKCRNGSVAVVCRGRPGVSEITRQAIPRRKVIRRCHGVASVWWSRGPRCWQRTCRSGRIVTERQPPEVWSPQQRWRDSRPAWGAGPSALRRRDTGVGRWAAQLPPGTVVSGPVSVACSQHVFVGGRLWSGPTVADTSPHSQGCSGTGCWSVP